MSWFYKDKEITTLPDDCEGFVYLITNKINNMNKFNLDKDSSLLEIKNIIVNER